MDKILIMNQDESEKIKEIIEKDIWDSIKEFLDLGIHIGEGDKAINITVGLLLIYHCLYYNQFYFEMDAQDSLHGRWFRMIN